MKCDFCENPSAVVDKLNKVSQKILSKINSLADDPRGDGCIKLSGKETYRVRQGLYRIIYEIENGLLVVNVIKVAHRSHVYKSN